MDQDIVCRVVAYFIALLNHWGVSIVVLVALLSPIVIMVLGGVALVGFYVVEGLVTLLSPIMVLDWVALGGGLYCRKALSGSCQSGNWGGPGSRSWG